MLVTKLVSPSHLKIASPKRKTEVASLFIQNYEMHWSITVGSMKAPPLLPCAYNFGRRLKTLKGLTPNEYSCKIWTTEPHRFILNPIPQMLGLNTYINAMLRKALEPRLDIIEMPAMSSAILFLGSLVLVTLTSAVLSKRLDQIGTWLSFSAGLSGLITALAADSPEIASSITALRSGHSDLGLGVIFGSNIFNLAALLGLGALVAGRITCSRETVLLNAGMAIGVTFLVMAQRLYGLTTFATGLLIAAVMIPFFAVSVLKPTQVQKLYFPPIGLKWLSSAVSATEIATTVGPPPRAPSWEDIATVVPLLAMIVLSSIGLVRAASALGAHLGWSEVTIGALVIASLTGIPNLITALRLSLRGRGAAVVSETYNSNSLNLIVGAYLPTLFVSPGDPSALARLSMWWLAGASVLSAALFLPNRRLGRLGGSMIAVSWVGFALVILAR
jgi:cation:H+ antiporter